MSITVFGDSISGNCLKVKWVLEKLDLPYRWVEVNILAGETHTPDFLARNSAGQVPVIVLEDGRALSQSNAIIIHLAEGTGLIPDDSYDRAHMLEWMFWEQYSHEPYVAVARFQVAYLGRAPEDLEPRIVERGKSALARLELALSGGGFLVGPRLSLADVALVAYTRVAHEGGFDLADCPSVHAWIGRVESELAIG
jgi:glutathione S-transferase